jgi:hypothetical protein
LEKNGKLGLETDKFKQPRTIGTRAAASNNGVLYPLDFAYTLVGVAPPQVKQVSPAFLAVTPNPEMMGLFWMREPRTLYGRRTEAFLRGTKIGDIVEVLPLV